MTLHNLTTTEQVVIEAFPKERECIFTLAEASATTDIAYIRVGGGEADLAISGYCADNIRCTIPPSTPVHAWMSANTAKLLIYQLPLK